MTLTPAQVTFYKENGFLGAIDIATSDEAERYRQQFDALEGKVGKEKAQVGLIDYHFQDEFIWELATHPRILDAVEALIGPNFLLLATHFFNKYGEGESAAAFVAWHQDVTFWGLEPRSISRCAPGKCPSTMAHSFMVVYPIARTAGAVVSLCAMCRRGSSRRLTIRTANAGMVFWCAVSMPRKISAILPHPFLTHGEYCLV